jgi:4,4'-diaponeurosporenoate glycosyltransferase
MTTVVLCLAGWALGWIAFGRPRFHASLAPFQGRRVAIVIPARNEAHNLPLLLGDLEALRPPGAEVVVVDDASDDATAEVAGRFPFVTVLHNEAPPPGWFGKPWACQVGADHTDAPLLCFLDADVRLRPGAFEVMVDQVQRRGGLVSVQPWHIARRPYEQASALFNVISVMGVGMGDSMTGRPARPSGAFGPAMMTMREDYELVGGHASVATEVIEDIALARVYREHDREVAVIPGRGLLGYRMYPNGLATLLEGWTKNFALGAGNTPLWRLLAVFLWLTAMGTTLTWAVDAVGGRVGWVGPAAMWIAFSWQLRRMFKVVGSFGWATALAFPLLLGLFFVVFFRSLWMTLVRRQVHWRGRTLSVGATR